MSFPTPDPREAAFETVLEATTEQMRGVLRRSGYPRAARFELFDAGLAASMIRLGLIYAVNAPDTYALEDLGVQVLERI